MNFTPEMLFELFAAAASGLGAYAAIRADLARLHERASQALNSAQRAHERIDSMTNHHH